MLNNHRNGGGICRFDTFNLAQVGDDTDVRSQSEETTHNCPRAIFVGAVHGTPVNGAEAGPSGGGRLHRNPTRSSLAVAGSRLFTGVIVHRAGTTVAAAHAGWRGWSPGEHSRCCHARRESAGHGPVIGPTHSKSARMCWRPYQQIRPPISLSSGRRRGAYWFGRPVFTGTTAAARAGELQCSADFCTSGIANNSSLTAATNVLADKLH